MENEIEHLSDVNTSLNLQSSPTEATTNDSPPDPDVVSAARLTVVMALCLFTVLVAGVIISNSQMGRTPQFEEFIIGYGYASTLAVVMTNVIWSALGAGKVRHRFAFALLWNLGVALASFIVLGINGPPPDLGPVLVVFVLFLTAAWLLPQAPLWLIRIWARVRFDLPGRTVDGKVNQFGIFQLLMVTGFVALFLGGARAAITLAKVEAPPDAEPFLAVGFLVLCAVLTSVPIWIAALIERYVFAALLIVLTLVIVASYWQQTLLGMLINMGGGPPASFFVWQSVFISSWTLIFAMVMRMNGYRFIRRAG